MQVIEEPEAIVEAIFQFYEDAALHPRAPNARRCSISDTRRRASAPAQEGAAARGVW